MPKFFLGLCALIFAFTTSAESISYSSGNKQVALIELFTSQGCSSCPPAEQWINQLTENPGLWSEFIPMAYHVDYWDGLGWRDIYAKPTYSNRQYRYQQQGHINTVYTPGFLINGQEWRGWRHSEIPVSQQQAGALSVNIEDRTFKAEYESTSEQPLVLNVAILGFDINTSIEAGENRGRNLEQQFIVLAHQQTHSRKNRWQSSLPSVKHNAEKYALVAWLSSLDNQQPIQATGGWLPKVFIN